MQHEIPSMTILPNMIGCKLLRYATAGANDYTYTLLRRYLKDRKRTRMIWQVPLHNHAWEPLQPPHDNSEWSKQYVALHRNRPPLWILTTLAYEILQHVPIFRGSKPPFQMEVACETYVAIADNDAQTVQFEIAMVNLGGCNARECYEFAQKLQALEERWYRDERSKLTGESVN